MARAARRVAAATWVMASFLAATPASVPQEDPSARVLRVGTKEAPPFSIKREDGSWSGISIDLWREIAAELQIQYELVEMDLTSLLQGLAARSLDVAVAALTVTEDRESAFDFSHPLHTAGLGIAVQSGGNHWAELMARFFSIEFAAIVVVVALTLVGVGFVIWLVERRQNAEHFGGGLARGLGAGVWWSAVTLTTVGYGDKAPKSGLGRLLAIVWMFAGILLISSFAAAVTSALTIGHLSSVVLRPADLTRVDVGTVRGSTSEQYLRRRSIVCRRFAALPEAIAALRSGEVDAVLYDAPLLRHLLAREEATDLHVLPTTFEHEDYAIGLVSGSPLREPLNRILLRRIKDESWNMKLATYLGQ